MPSSSSLAPAANGMQSANDNITRFNPPSRVLSPLSHALFHNKTRCFV
jgi:ATP citrate (pro-S)-lyase